jgi:twitching motility protein PilU
MDNSRDFLLPDQQTIPTLEELMRLMAKHNGSDLFASAGAFIKIKIEGRLVSLCPIPLKPDDIYLILAEGLNSEQLGTLDETKELNCAIPVQGVGRFRVSAMVQRNSKAFVIRYIPHTIPDFESLNLPSSLGDLIMRKRGLMLVVGPTGSGKSTTLASLVDYRNKTRDDHILTIEDPIEFLFKHQRSIVNQREVGTDSLSYHESLRNALRQAPDVILIGEIRDQETMDMAMQYAQSGHLCIATMHANNSYHALNRIVGFYSPDYRQALYQDLASSLNAIVAQRLIPTLDGKRAAAVEILENSIRIRELIEKGAINDIPEAMERS